MGKLLLTFILCFAALKGTAQNNQIARIKFEQAEEDFNKNDFNNTIKNLKECESLLGTTNPKIMYLKISAQIKLIEQNPYDNFELLKNTRLNVQKYLKDYENLPNNYEKYKEIFLISQTLDKYPKTIEEFNEKRPRELYEIGFHYYLKHNYPLAIEYYKKAAELGYDTALERIANIYRYDTKNYPLAIEYYIKLAEKGNKDAFEDIGDIYYYNLDNKSEAVDWYKKAANNGNPEGMAGLFWVYLHDENIENLKTAANWYEKAIANGTKEIKREKSMCAYYVLGEFYEKKLMDEVSALKWYLKAAEKNNSYDANYKVYLLYKEGKSTKNKELAKIWYKKAFPQ